jgi:hypothetical protein
MNQETTDITVAALRYASEPFLAAAGVLSGNQPKPGRQLTPGVELRGIADRRDQGRGRDHPDTGDRLEPAARLTGAVPGQQFLLQAKNLCLNHPKLADERPIKTDCCSADFTAAKRIVGRISASQIASASDASFLFVLTNGFTYCGGISRTA